MDAFTDKIDTHSRRAGMERMLHLDALRAKSAWYSKRMHTQNHTRTHVGAFKDHFWTQVVAFWEGALGDGSLLYLDIPQIHKQVERA